MTLQFKSVLEWSIWSLNDLFIGIIAAQTSVHTYMISILTSSIFRDLAARNILVFSRNKVKISDFGLSRQGIRFLSNCGKSPLGDIFLFLVGVGKDYYQTNFNVNLKLPIAWYVNVIDYIS